MTEDNGLAATARKSPEESVQEEKAAVGNHPDTGGLVPPDHSQSTPDAGEHPGDQPAD